MLPITIVLVHVLARLATQVGGWLGGWVAPNDRGPGFALERQMTSLLLSTTFAFCFCFWKVVVLLGY
jgi:hypothetical protein